MAHEAEIIIPGSFVCLQGSPGDGLRNFMTRRLPKLPRNTEVSERRAVDVNSSNGDDGHGNNHKYADHKYTDSKQRGPTTAPGHQAGPGVAMLGALAATQVNPSFGSMASAPPSLVATSSPPPAMSSFQASRQLQPNIGQSVNVVSDDQLQPPSAVRRRKLKRSIEEWVEKCQEKEKEQRMEWRETVLQIKGRAETGQAMMDMYEEGEMWWQSGGLLAVLSDIPTKAPSGEIIKNTIGTINPGSTIVATEIVHLGSVGFERLLIPPAALSGDRFVYPRPRSSLIQLIQIDYEGRSGYVCLSLDGYWLLGPGLLNLYIDPHVWVWRVVCPAGAFVREGLELNTRHIDTLPYGSLVRVSRRTMNSQGLMRLQVQSKTDDAKKHKQRWIDGWCSEYLNPQSGQRGIVIQPLSFPVPALYRVTLAIGAVIRNDVELSSPQVGVAPMGKVLAIVGRAFSEHPVDKCIERLQLAGNGGWISVRLNRPPPNDDLVVELIGIDGQYDPGDPGLYHLEAQQRIQPTAPLRPDGARSSSSGGLSSIDSVSSETSRNNVSSEISCNNSLSRNSRHGLDRSGANKCLICLAEERNATIVHGETGHVACCLICARILKARGDKCPVCRLNIDLVIQQFWA
eukprot:scaffold902_cov147-Cylindrotheca_fusiformis.AAC.5